MPFPPHPSPIGGGHGLARPSVLRGRLYIGGGVYHPGVAIHRRCRISFRRYGRHRGGSHERYDSCRVFFLARAHILEASSERKGRSKRQRGRGTSPCVPRIVLRVQKRPWLAVGNRGLTWWGVCGWLMSWATCVVVLLSDLPCLPHGGRRFFSEGLFDGGKHPSRLEYRRGVPERTWQ